jgi:hypothetical protein
VSVLAVLAKLIDLSRFSIERGLTCFFATGRAFLLLCRIMLTIHQLDLFVVQMEQA